ncbi:MAG: glycoside hydrolase family 3 protein [Lentisphaerae bacterium]|nr:glycoside hydrolase family 3 protein [Lentisphaerota bacterium]
MKIDKRYLDTSLSFSERAAILVSNMTLREKIAQMLHSAPPIPRLGIGAYTWWNECLHGVGRSGLATVFPQSIGRAATFDEKLEKRLATAISDEARAKYNLYRAKGYSGMYSGLTFWSPNINIFRDPRWGRGQETFGEDPYLTARMGVAFVKGLQGDDKRYLKAAACAKHYAVHSGPEGERHTFDSVVNGRDLRETYLPAFEALVREGGVEAIMTAYNRVNGEPCSASELLLDKILRQEWGFKGHVVSDCGAVEDIHEHHKLAETTAEAAAMAVKAGCDLCCGEIYKNLLAAVKQGLIDEATITTSVERLFTTRMKLGMFDPEGDVPWSGLGAAAIGSAAHRALALECAEKSVVLLKNNGILPLSHERVKSIGVCGPLAQDVSVLMGNYNGFPAEATTYLSGIVKVGGEGMHVLFMKGCETIGGGPVTEGGLAWCFGACDVIIACVGNTAELEGEEGDAYNADAGGDRRRIGLPGNQQELLEAVCRQGKPVIAVVSGGSAIDLSWAHENCAAVLMAWYPGEAGGEAVARILFGETSPSGRLPVTFPRSVDDLPHFHDYSMKNRTYRYAEKEPLYHFGYGLSYTKFAYSNLKLSSKTVWAGDGVELTVDVKNSGKVAGEEVVQLYVSAPRIAGLVQPRHQLAAFTRVKLRSGASKTVKFKLDPWQLASYTEEGLQVIEPGVYRVAVGGGEPDTPGIVVREAELTVR